MKERISVLGATGMLGAPVARHLHKAGFVVRILARDVAKARKVFSESFELVYGDVTDLASLRQAMTDCYGVHISVGGAVDQISAENVAALAPVLDVAHITYISGSTVRKENGWFPMTAQKLAAETAVIQSRIPYTIFCPTWPMEQLPRFVIGGQATLVGDRPVPWRWFAAADLGRMVAQAYQQKSALNKRLYVHGPEALTMPDALDQYCRTFHPGIAAVNMMPIEMARRIAASTGNQMLAYFADLMAYFQQVGEPGDPAEANDLLGAPTTTLTDWIAQRNTEQERGK